MVNVDYKDVLTSPQVEVAQILANVTGKEDPYYLAGGNAIALQLGHRKSIDFDMFTMGQIDELELIRIMGRVDRVLVSSRDELTVIKNGVKCSFLHYPFELRTNKDKYHGFFYLTELLDLAASKAYTLGRRSKWKDYVDLYYLLDVYSITEIVSRAREIYGNIFSEKLFYEQLTYRDDIDYSEEVDYLQENPPANDEIFSRLEEAVLS